MQHAIIDDFLLNLVTKSLFDASSRLQTAFVFSTWKTYHKTNYSSIHLDGKTTQLLNVTVFNCSLSTI